MGIVNGYPVSPTCFILLDNKSWSGIILCIQAHPASHRPFSDLSRPYSAGVPDGARNLEDSRSPSGQVFAPACAHCNKESTLLADTPRHTSLQSPIWPESADVCWPVVGSTGFSSGAPATGLLLKRLGSVYIATLNFL